MFSQALLYADPFDVEAQNKIEAAIRQKGIDENWEAALEHNPEAFARVVKLYVDMEVNGVPMKASGRSKEHSNLNQPYKGVAHGVGQTEILGQRHVAPIKIGNPCSFLVLDSPNLEFLFGLDMLRKHQCIIDLKENVLLVGGGEVSVPFLQEKDIPSWYLDEEKYSEEASSSGSPRPVASGSNNPSHTDSGDYGDLTVNERRINENWEAALKHNPEAFARVVMLYVDMEVNGVSMKAFVHSGAQSTIISKSCAERLGLLSLLDKRYRGVAHGVGQTEILGRIHVAPINIGNIFYPCSFLVLDSANMEFLFGLDMLRKHQCIIDLKENVLRVGGGEVSVPFLQEKDIPSRYLDDEKYSKEASSSVSPRPAASGSNSLSQAGASSGGASGDKSKDSVFESKVAKLVELGFDRQAVIQALQLFNGNDEQAVGFLFG
ncbi:hypothetical protein TSUD_127150 [Trifolium subterraneum]|nr:hypothetical protein TSUD_127150 [Trifolium subterraneum]